jgi:hypothetical protein
VRPQLAASFIFHRAGLPSFGLPDTATIRHPDHRNQETVPRWSSGTFHPDAYLHGRRFQLAPPPNASSPDGAFSSQDVPPVRGRSLVSPLHALALMVLKAVLRDPHHGKTARLPA